jgi:hypothetical protein
MRVPKFEPDFRLKLRELQKDLLAMVSSIQFDLMNTVKTTRGSTRRSSQAARTVLN